MQTETLRILPKLHKAVVHLQALPEVQQEQIVKIIEDFYQVLPVIDIQSQSDIDMEKLIEQPTRTIEQARAKLEMMSEEQRKQVFLFIEFICWQEGIVLAEDEEIKS